MPIPLHISPRLIKSIASLYNDVNRILLEFVDNSLDSAEALYDESSNSFSRKILIDVIINGNSYRNGKIVIRDNCTGITNLKKVVQSIGDSDKKAQPWTNGQFGYGIYSFMAGCEKLEITTKLENEDALFIPIDKSKFDASKQEDVTFPDLEKKFSFHADSGTLIELKKFDNHSWKLIRVDDLKSEIEKHFELLLGRQNLIIHLINDAGQTFRCRPFNYESVNGDVYKENINLLRCQKGRKVQQTFYKEIEPPIQIYLKLTKGQVLNKPPIFVMKGRRIGEIREVRAFRSIHKSDIWNHPNLTGYIDLKSRLEPTIARNDFKNTSDSKAVFNKLIELEPLILAFIEDINKRSAQRHYQVLEDYLNQALSKLARLDTMRFRTDFISGAESNLEQTDIESDRLLKLVSNDQEIEKQDESEIEKKEKNKEEEGLKKQSGENREPEGFEYKENIDSHSDAMGRKSRRSGFNIRIVEREPDINTLTNKPEKSRLIDDTIEIFRKHPEFESRVVINRKGEQIITQRLILYLAGEITVHYKDKFHNRHGTPVYEKHLFSDLVDFIYQFEEMLKDLDGKNLSEIKS